MKLQLRNCNFLANLVQHHNHGRCVHHPCHNNHHLTQTQFILTWFEHSNNKKNHGNVKETTIKTLNYNVASMVDTTLTFTIATTTTLEKPTSTSTLLFSRSETPTERYMRDVFYLLRPTRPVSNVATSDPVERITPVKFDACAA